MIEAMRQFIGTNDMMAYLVMMAQRIKELHRVLKPRVALPALRPDCEPLPEDAARYGLRGRNFRS